MSSSAHPSRSRSLPTASSSSPSSLASSSHHTHSGPPTRERQHSYSSYPSTPLAGFFPLPAQTTTTTVFPSFAADEPARSTRPETADAFGMGGFFESGGDVKGWGWLAGKEEYDDDEDDESSEADEEEVKERWRDSWATAAGAGGEGPTSPVLETHFGFAEELMDDAEDGENKNGRLGYTTVKEVHDLEDDPDDGLGPLSKTSSSSLLAFLPSPTGSFQHVEHEDTLLRTYSSTHLALGDTRLTEREMEEARIIEHGGQIAVGGGWREWIGV